MLRPEPDRVLWWSPNGADSPSPSQETLLLPPSHSVRASVAESRRQSPMMSLRTVGFAIRGDRHSDVASKPPLTRRSRSALPSAAFGHAVSRTSFPCSANALKSCMCPWDCLRNAPGIRSATNRISRPLNRYSLSLSQSVFSGPASVKRSRTTLHMPSPTISRSN